MMVKAIKCPSCGASVHIEEGVKTAKCPYCDTSIVADYETESPKKPDTTLFTDEKTGLPLGTAVIPEGWHTQGIYTEREIDDITPFGTILNTYSPDQTMRMTSQFGERWYQHLTKSFLSSFYPKHCTKNYLDPKEYLADLASRILNSPFTPVTFGSITTSYSANKSVQVQKIVGRFNENARIILPNVQCDYKLQNVLCDSYAASGRFQNNGQEYSMIIGADLYGLEFYDASPMASVSRTITNGVGKLLSGNTSSFSSAGSDLSKLWNQSMEAMKSGEESNLFSMDFYKGGGLVGVLKRQKQKMQTQQPAAPVNTPAASPAQEAAPSPNEPVAFGHARQAGKQADEIEWGAKRVYYAIGPSASEEELLKKFLIFAGSYQQDPGLDQRLEQVHQQVRQQEQMNLQGATNYAFNAQQANMQRQAQISKTLQQSSNTIMQGWENRQASQSRMSNNFSEAIRGVNSYTTTDGRTVEHSVASDHVYENKYGDTIGVSGTGFSQETMNDLGLTELDKK